ncbi:hypothetical protein [Marinobacterium litorale]|jgi:hypothetical protein|uniref:hypothetical protein n=1 Tax=Marinobacterium litorale TaxID=404770 RepID=UPI00040F50B0|nr:hypothetical protein [Marinobacterium litorale]
MEINGPQCDRKPELPILGSAAALVVVAAVLAFTGFSSLWVGTLCLLGALLVVAGLMTVKRERCCWQAQVGELQDALIGQQVTDPLTGAALPEWFDKAMDTECRRAVREFTPLTVMQFLITGDAAAVSASRQALAEHLTEEVSRPGDLVGMDSVGGLQVLLPSTNENAGALAERCVERAQAVLAAGAEVRLVACTLQPKADLSVQKVRQYLDLLVEEAQSQPSGQVCYRAESVEADSFNPTFTL